MRFSLLALLLVTLFANAASAQLFDDFGQGFDGGNRRQRGGPRRNNFSRDLDFSVPSNRNGVPTWTVDPEFSGDVFTFVRIITNNGSSYTDYPDSDLNFSFRLQQLTSLKTNPNPITLRLTDPELFRYPFVYFCEPGGGRGGGGYGLALMPDEVKEFRRYLENGGFAMFDDFWGPYEYDAFYRDIKKVFPDREPVELEVTHDIFKTVYKLDERPQVPAIGNALGGRRSEYRDDPASYKAIFDDKGRMMCLICHNTDLGDGWEREGENEWYFHEYSEKRAYPMGINIIFYMMTH